MPLSFSRPEVCREQNKISNTDEETPLLRVHNTVGRSRGDDSGRGQEIPVTKRAGTVRDEADAGRTVQAGAAGNEQGVRGESSENVSTTSGETFSGKNEFADARRQELGLDDIESCSTRLPRTSEKIIRNEKVQSAVERFTEAKSVGAARRANGESGSSGVWC